MRFCQIAKNCKMQRGIIILALKKRDVIALQPVSRAPETHDSRLRPRRTRVRVSLWVGASPTKRRYSGRARHSLRDSIRDRNHGNCR